MIIYTHLYSWKIIKTSEKNVTSVKVEILLIFYYYYYYWFISTNNTVIVFLLKGTICIVQPIFQPIFWFFSLIFFFPILQKQLEKNNWKKTTFKKATSKNQTVKALKKPRYSICDSCFFQKFKKLFPKAFSKNFKKHILYVTYLFFQNLFSEYFWIFLNVSKYSWIFLNIFWIFSIHLIKMETPFLFICHAGRDFFFALFFWTTQIVRYASVLTRTIY